MDKAIEAAKASRYRGDYPIGAILYNIKTKEIHYGENHVKGKDDSTRHAEIELIRHAVSRQDGPYLEDWVLYTTHEPCPMCAAAAVWAKLHAIVYAIPMEEIGNRTNEMLYYKWRVINVKCYNIIKDTKIKLIENFLYEKAKKLFDR